MGDGDTYKIETEGFSDAKEGTWGLLPTVSSSENNYDDLNEAVDAAFYDAQALDGIDGSSGSRRSGVVVWETVSGTGPGHWETASMIDELLLEEVYAWVCCSRNARI